MSSKNLNPQPATRNPQPTTVLHRAEWVVPVVSPPVRGGAVLVKDGRILAVGPFSQLRLDLPPGTKILDHGRAAIMPALVNAHTHLDLCALRGKIAFPRAGFADWIGSFFPLRAGLAPETIREGFLNGMAELLDCGTALCGDVTNGAAVPSAVSGPSRNPQPATRNPMLAEGLPQRFVFLELLGFNCNSLAEAIPPGVSPGLNGGPVPHSAGGPDTRYPDHSTGGPDTRYPDHSTGGPDTRYPGAKRERLSRTSSFTPVPHSAYSVSPSIISEAGYLARARGAPFSIHVAEHAEEIEFLQSGTGFCRDLLESLGRWDPQWNPPRKTPVEYLDRLGALDANTLLVHAVHMNHSDWALAAGRKCPVCFCPRSNFNLGVGRPDIEKALSLGITACLGTDSLASNTDLNLFAEAAFVLDRYPGIGPDTVLEMITANPAGALGGAADFGAVKAGLGAALLAVEFESDPDDSHLAEALIRSGKKGAWKWVTS